MLFRNTQHYEQPADYETWQRNAIAVMNAFSGGQVLEIVTIRPVEFLAGPKDRDLPNTAEARRCYVEILARHIQDVA